MEVVLQYKNNCYRKTTINRNMTRRTNRYSSIRDFVKSLPEPVSIEVTSNLKINYGNNNYLILKDYKKVLEQERKKNFGFYSDIINSIKSEIPITKRVNNINAKRIATIALTAVVFLTSSGIIKNNLDKKDNINDQEVVYFEETNNNVSQFLKDDFESEIISNVEVDSEKEIVLNVESSSNAEEDFSVPQEDFDLIHRVEQTNNIYCGNIENNHNFPICTKMDAYAMNKVVKFLNSDEGQYFINYGEQFGVDPYLLCALSLTESSMNHYGTLPGGSNYNGYAVGIMQHETPELGRYITAYNYSTESSETIKMDMDKACDLETNIKMGAMIIQNYMHKYNNNIYLVLQAYNYGYSTMDMLINLYAKETNQTYEDILNNHNDLGWMKYVKDLNQNPQKYLSNWQHKTYGNSEYISKVLGFYLGVQSKNILEDGTICYTNLLTMEKVYENSNVKTF